MVREGFKSSAEWQYVMEQVQDIVHDFLAEGCSTPFFRGQMDSSWYLEPSLARNVRPLRDIEKQMYVKFRAHGAHLLPAQGSTWDDLYLMRHHGFPTRLLDWTEHFAIALYFAMPEYHNIQGHSPEAGSIYILNPAQLNKEFWGQKGLCSLSLDFPEGYAHYFLKEGRHFEEIPRVLAVGGASNNDRMRAQASVYTLHNNPLEPLDSVLPNAIERIDIPSSIMEDVNFFLWLAGVNRFTVYQDLDNLGEHISFNEFY